MNVYNRTSAPYRIGDYYNDGRHTGVVFVISDGSYHGKIVAVHEGEGVWCKCPDKQDICVSEISGKENKRIVVSMGRENDYPILLSLYLNGFTHDYYIPAIQELQQLSAVRDIINETLDSVYGERFCIDDYVSSTEKHDQVVAVYMRDGRTWKKEKDEEFYYRVVYEF